MEIHKAKCRKVINAFLSSGGRKSTLIWGKRELRMLFPELIAIGKF